MISVMNDKQITAETIFHFEYFNEPKFDIKKFELVKNGDEDFFKSQLEVLNN
jgi:hypothetical protein